MMSFVDGSLRQAGDRNGWCRRAGREQGSDGQVPVQIRERYKVEAKIGLLCVLVLTGDVDTEG